MFALQNDAHCSRLAFDRAKFNGAAYHYRQTMSDRCSLNLEQILTFKFWVSFTRPHFTGYLRFDNFNLQNTEIPPAIGAPKMVEFPELIQSRLIWTCSRPSRPFQWVLRKSSVACNATEFNKCGLWKLQRNRIYAFCSAIRILSGVESVGPYNW